MVGSRANGGSISRLRFDHPALRPQKDAEIVVRVGVIRIERNRPLTGGDRLVQLESIAQDDRQIAVPVRSIGLELETPLDQLDCLLAPPLLMGEHARVVDRVGIVGRDLENAAVDVAAAAHCSFCCSRIAIEIASSRLTARSRRHRSRPVQPSLLPLMSYLKWSPASSDPSAFCGLYSRVDLGELQRDALGGGGGIAGDRSG